MSQQDQRRIFLNIIPSKPREFVTNRVRRSKYTVWNFLPKNLYQQFKGAANFYFLVLAIIQTIPPFKEVDVIVTVLPLLIIFLSTAIKDGFEDFKRHQADNVVNKSTTYALSGYLNPNGKNTLSKNPIKTILRQIQKKLKSIWSSKKGKVYPDNSHDAETPFSSTSILNPEFSPCEWQNIRVGDFLLLRNGDKVPADVLILSTSEPDCVCFVETKNLDGETNLKVKKGIPEFQGIKKPGDCLGVTGFIDTEMPNPNLYTFQGRFVLQKDEQEMEMPLGPSNVLLRGCTVQNTSWVIGVVFYTGTDTKVMLNSGPAPLKRSRVDKQVNPHILINCIILVTLCTICGIIAALYSGTFVFSSPVYLGTSNTHIETPQYQSFFTFFMLMIIFQNIIPIALYLSMEVTKSIQSYLIYSDVDMYDEQTGKSVQPKAWNLCDDLGQIEYIFSDKTGTLTSNEMEFRKCSINGVSYGKGANYESDKIASQKKFSELFEWRYFDQDPSFVDPLLPQHILENGVQAVKIREFFSLLAVCHTVLVERPEESNPHTIRYLAQSPDEAALVSAAKNAGFACLDRTDNKVEVDVMGIPRTYTILNIMEFNSDRKRMSVLVKRPEGDVLLLCKGADSVIYERLDKEKSEPLLEITSEHLQQFANEGNDS